MIVLLDVLRNVLLHGVGYCDDQVRVSNNGVDVLSEFLDPALTNELWVTDGDQIVDNRANEASTLAVPSHSWPNVHFSPVGIWQQQNRLLIRDNLTSSASTRLFCQVDQKGMRQFKDPEMARCWQKYFLKFMERTILCNGRK